MVRDVHDRMDGYLSGAKPNDRYTVFFGSPRSMPGSLNQQLNDAFAALSPIFRNPDAEKYDAC